MAKVAVITGGASGLGLAVAEAFAAQGEWKFHLLDADEDGGKRAAKSLKAEAISHHVDVTSYDAQASAFREIFEVEQRIDFVFANAGVAEKNNFYAVHSAGESPPAPPFHIIDINVKGVVFTSYLALHYFRQSPGKKGEKNLILTASCCGIYPTPVGPQYSASKHAVVGFTRSIARNYYELDGIRVNAILPGTVKTNIITDAQWKTFPTECLTPISTVVKTVTELVGGQTLTDAKGNKVIGDFLWGQTAELSGENFYFRNQQEYCDEQMKLVMERTDRKELHK